MCQARRIAFVSTDLLRTRLPILDVTSDVIPLITDKEARILLSVTKGRSDMSKPTEWVRTHRTHRTGRHAHTRPIQEAALRRGGTGRSPNRPMSIAQHLAALRELLASDDKFLVVVAGPNGAGKTTFVQRFLKTTGILVPLRRPFQIGKACQTWSMQSHLGRDSAGLSPTRVATLRLDQPVSRGGPEHSQQATRSSRAAGRRQDR